MNVAPYRKLYGVDVLLDDKLRPYVLEYNCAPTFMSTLAECPERVAVKHAMLGSLLRGAETSERWTAIPVGV